MKKLPPFLLRFFRTGVVALALPSVAQVPNTLLHPLAPPPLGAQSYAQLGSSVAIDGGYTVTGEPGCDFRGTDTGVAKVFDSTTGTLLFTVPNPEPGDGDTFASAVAVSGSFVVVGAPFDDADALNAGRAYVFDLTSATPTKPVFTLANPSAATDDYFGIAVAISGTKVVIGASEDDTGAANAGCAYVYDIGGAMPTVPTATVHNPSPAANDLFGYSVAISGTRCVIGARLDDAGATNAGSAYVYDLGGITPALPIATLNNPAPAANDEFGFAVAASGSRVLIGARLDDFAATNSGTVYAYDVSGSLPLQPPITINNPSPASNSGFGSSVAISGSYATVGGSSGKCFVYDLGSVTPVSPVATLGNSAGGFGRSVAITGTRIAVGAPFDDTSAIWAGKAYLYELTSATPTMPKAEISNPSPSTGDQFGFSMALSGGLLVVGAPRGNPDIGNVCVYDLKNASPWTPILILTNPDPEPWSMYGSAVAISGTRVVVGACQADGGSIDAGRAYVYNISSGSPAIPDFVLPNPSPAGGDRFGAAVAISGTKVAIGACNDGTAASGAGSVYIYDLGAGNGSLPTMTLNKPNAAVNDGFGYSLAISGSRLVVGAHADSSDTLYGGRAYVFDLASGTPSVPSTVLINPNAANDDNFGFAVGISGVRVVVGAINKDAAGVDSGSAYVFDLDGTTPAVPVVVLNNPSPTADDQFGCSVGIAGALVVVGANKDDAFGNDVGSAYVYDTNSATPTIPIATLQKPNPRATDYFGTSVVIDETTVAVGASGDDLALADKGAVYIFGPHPMDQDSDGLLDSWELAQFGTTTGHNALGDFDHDGMCELLELAFGSNPTQSSPSALPVAVDESGYLTMTITKQAGVLYEVQSAATLLLGQPESFSAATTTVITNNATTLKVRDNFLLGTTPNRFMRVKVTAAP